MELHQKKPHLIVLVGIPGAGKSFFAENFAKSFKAPIVSTEIIRKTLFRSPTYDKNEELAIQNVSRLMLDEVLKTKRTVIFRGKTDTKSSRSSITKLCHDMGYDPLLIWVQTDMQSSKKRYLKGCSDKSSSASLRFDNYIKKFDPPHIHEKPIVISGKQDYESQLKIVLNNIVKRSPVLDSSEVTDENKFFRHRYLIR